MKLLSLCVTLAISPLGAPLVAQEAAPTDFEGNWLGTMNAGGAQLRMRIDLTVEDGVLGARMFSVDQGNAEIPVESATVAGNTLSLTMPMIGGSYEGTLSDDGQTIDGTFQQMGAELPLVLERMEGDEPDAGRPRTRWNRIRTSRRMSATPTRMAATNWPAPSPGPATAAPSRP